MKRKHEMEVDYDPEDEKEEKEELKKVRRNENVNYILTKYTNNLGLWNFYRKET